MKKTNNTPQIIINGNHANFTGNTFINNLECNIKLDRLGKRELNNLYKSSESVRSAARKKTQKKYVQDVENYLYKSIHDVVNLIQSQIENDTTKEQLSTELFPTFKHDNNNDVGSLAFALKLLSTVIISNIENIKESEVKKAFTENVKELFSSEEINGTKTDYTVKDNRIIEVISKAI